MHLQYRLMSPLQTTRMASANQSKASALYATWILTKSIMSLYGARQHVETTCTRPVSISGESVRGVKLCVASTVELHGTMAMETLTFLNPERWAKKATLILRNNSACQEQGIIRHTINRGSGDSSVMADEQFLHEQRVVRSQPRPDGWHHGKKQRYPTFLGTKTRWLHSRRITAIGDGVRYEEGLFVRYTKHRLPPPFGP